jgi:predicted helicase
MPSLFPTVNHDNFIICIYSSNSGHPLISKYIADFHFNGDNICFPRYYYEPIDDKQETLFTQAVGGYVRHDGLTDYILSECRVKYGPEVTKDHIFYYVYAILHSKDYREKFSADLKRSLPRVPLVKKTEDFAAFYRAGMALAEIHLNYESVEPYHKAHVSGEEKGNFLVDKIRYINDDKSAIQYNPFIKITGIPQEAHEYVVNRKSAIDWILDRSQVNVDNDRGIKNDPNDWAKERNEPRYILDLLLRIVTVSLETMKIIKRLPKLDF